MKDGFIEGTGEACFVVFRMDTPDVWQSVQVFGRLERVVGTQARLVASVISKLPLPPEWALEKGAAPTRSGRGAYVLSLVASRMTGRKSALAVGGGTPDVA